MQHTVYLFDGFQLDVTRRKLISSGGLVQPLNSRAMDALLLLVANAGELVEKRRLMETIWPNAVVEDNNLNQCILAIRKALGEVAGSNRYIMTVPGRGYRFVSPVHSSMQESTAETASLRVQSGSSSGRRHSRAMWLGGAGAVLVALLAVILFRVVRPAVDPLMASMEVAGTVDKSSPAIVLRLREPVTVGGGNMESASTTLLARCLTARPGMKLRVQVQLVGDGGTTVWTGSYVAGAQDLLALQVGGTASAPGCRELIAAAGLQQAQSSTR
ncbi:MAG: transcriptional regulator [Pseudomonadota bacterium]